LPAAKGIHPQSNKFATGVENKGTEATQLYDSSENAMVRE